MSRSFVTSDHHFYHENIIKYTGRPFAGVEEMYETMIRCWNEVVGPDDLVWHLGDFCMSGHLDDMRRNVSVEKTGFYPVNLGKIRSEVLKKMNAKPSKSDLSEQNRTVGEPAVKNRETRKAIADAVAGKCLSRIYDNIEEMFDDLDTAYDDYPEITQQDFDRAVKRKGLKPFPADKKD